MFWKFFCDWIMKFCCVGSIGLIGRFHFKETVVNVVFNVVI
jgi:hypothetical protein